MKECPPTLMRHTKWLKLSRPVHIEDVAIICDGNMTRSSWPKGPVVAVHPGQDGIVRVVDVKRQPECSAGQSPSCVSSMSDTGTEKTNIL